MKKIAYPVTSLFLILALAGPGLAQDQPQAETREEYDAYVAFFNETNPAAKAELGEKFIADYPESEFRPDSFLLLIRAYMQAQNWASVLDVAERFTAAFPDAEIPRKVSVYEIAMTAAQQANEFDRIIEYGDRILALQPDNFNAQITLSSMIPERLPQDEAAKADALRKAEDLATRAIGQVQQIFSQPRPPNFTDEQWSRERANLQGQLHATLGLVHLNRSEYEESAQQYELALRAVPNDGVSHFRLGLAFQYMASDASRQLLMAIERENEAKANRAEQAEIDELVAAREAIEEDVRSKRDRSIDELAMAVAIGGVVAQPARDQLERLYRAKNDDSLEGLDELIGEKRALLSATP